MSHSQLTSQHPLVGEWLKPSIISQGVITSLQQSRSTLILLFFMLAPSDIHIQTHDKSVDVVSSYRTKVTQPVL